MVVYHTGGASPNGGEPGGGEGGNGDGSVNSIAAGGGSSRSPSAAYRPPKKYAA